MDGISLPLIIAYSKPVLFVLALSLASITVLALFTANPKWPTLGLFLVILSFVNPSYGFLEQVHTNIYAWGTGKLPFPLIHFYLYGLFLAVVLRNQFTNVHPLKQAGAIWFILFSLMYLGHFIMGQSEVDHWMQLLQTRGIIHILHMGMMMYVVASVLNNEKDINTFIKIFMVIAMGRAIFGLARFFLFGGDPQNAYDNLGGVNVKLTYWDSVESLIASIAAFIYMWWLANDWRTLRPRMRYLFIACLVIELLVVILSFRRANLGGLLLLGTYFVLLLPWRKRVTYAAIGMAILIPSALSVAAYRAQETFGTRQLSIWEIVSPDASKSSKLTERGSRFYELYVAARGIEENPIFGLGLWGSFKVGIGDAQSLSYHQGQYDFVHSGFGHVLMKSGVMGLTLFVGILLAAWRYAGKARQHVAPKYRPLFEGYRAGLWFMFPTLMFATPIIELRTMLWLAMLLAVPIAIARFSLSENALRVKQVTG